MALISPAYSALRDMQGGKKKKKKYWRKPKFDYRNGPVIICNLKKKDDFYSSKLWFEVRYQALKRDGGQCQCCGRGRSEGIKLHVDHIKPRSKFPDLALNVDNLQVLCWECNLGKSNTDSTDWR